MGFIRNALSGAGAALPAAIPIWVWGLVGAVVLSAVVGVLGWIHHSIYTSGERAAQFQCAAENAQRDKEARAREDAAVEQVRMANAAAALKTEAAVRLQNQADTAYQKGIEDGKADRDRVIASLRAGQRLRVDVAASSCRGGGQLPNAATAAGGSDGAATADLSRGAAERLVELANRCDNLARQLTAAQAVINADRTAINGPAPAR